MILNVYIRRTGSEPTPDLRLKEPIGSRLDTVAAAGVLRAGTSSTTAAAAAAAVGKRRRLLLLRRVVAIGLWKVTFG